MDDLTEENVHQCVNERCMHKMKIEQLHLVNQDVREVTMNSQIVDATGRVWRFKRNYCNGIRNAGYGDLILQNSYTALRHVLRMLKPLPLYRWMMNLIGWRKISKRKSSTDSLEKCPGKQKT